MITVQLMPLDVNVCKTVFVEVLGLPGRQFTFFIAACMVLKILNKNCFAVVFALFSSKITFYFFNRLRSEH